MANAKKAEERARQKAICSGNATAPSPDSAIACSIAFICAFLCKLCVHTLEAPSCSAAGVNDSSGACAGANLSLHIGCRASDVAVVAVSPASHSSTASSASLHPSSVVDWSYRTEKAISSFETEKTSVRISRCNKNVNHMSYPFQTNSNFVLLLARRNGFGPFH